VIDEREAALFTVPEHRRTAGSGPAAALPTRFGVSISQHCHGQRPGLPWGPCSSRERPTGPATPSTPCSTRSSPSTRRSSCARWRRPSCGGRRMTERAAHLVDAVLPWVPVQRWVLTVPYRLRYQMAWNHGMSRAVLRVYTRVLLEVYARGAREYGVGGGQTGMVTALQRAGSGLNVNLHFHTLVTGRGVHRSTRGRAGVSSGAGAGRRRGRWGAGHDLPAGAAAADAPGPRRRWPRPRTGHGSTPSRAPGPGRLSCTGPSASTCWRVPSVEAAYA
jgi:hypothetical protein